jgi:hypothetical protein
MTHDEANAAQRRIFAVDDLTRAARLVELSIGAFEPVDDKTLRLAMAQILLVRDYQKAIAAKLAPTPAPLGDVKF